MDVVTIFVTGGIPSGLHHNLKRDLNTRPFLLQSPKIWMSSHMGCFAHQPEYPAYPCASGNPSGVRFVLAVLWKQYWTDPVCACCGRGRKTTGLDG